MTAKTYLLCMGTRPEIIKMAPVYRALKASGQQVQVLHTGQHEEVARALYTFFDMEPDISMVLNRQSASLAHLSSALIDGIDPAIKALAPDVVLVQGDTTSALIGALAGYYQNIPVGHVEAGLRTGEREPFPEEKNRELIGRLARWHFAPTLQCRYNLLGEGVDAARVFEVGNTVIDAAFWTRDRLSRSSAAQDNSLPESAQQFLSRQADRKLLLITAHRRENWGQPIRSIAKALAEIIANHEDTAAIWPSWLGGRMSDALRLDWVRGQTDGGAMSSDNPGVHPVTLLEPSIDLRLANSLLARMDAPSRDHLLLQAELVELEAGDPLGRAGQTLTHVYFPIDCMISVLSRPIEGRRFEVGLIGFEGMLGTANALGVSACAFDSKIIGAGRAWKIETLVLDTLRQGSSSLCQLLIRYLYFELYQMGALAACGRFHSLSQRLARLILMSLDRTRCADLRLTHETMADALGMRRAGVSEQAAEFQKEGLIQYSRGQLLVTNRAGLVKASCSCYAHDLMSYEHMLKP
jgi:UDP-N-acetylglucosamine 2-epimerase